MTETGLDIRDGGPGDLDGISRLHKNGIPSLLAELSLGFIRLFYRNALRLDQAWVRCAFRGSGLAGFYLFALGREFSFPGVFLARPLSFLLEAARSPGSALRLLRHAVCHRELQQPVSGPQLVYLLVAPESRRCGAGRALFHDLAQRLGALGLTEFTVHVDQDNPSALAFYLAVGCEAVGRERIGGRDLILIRHPLKVRTAGERGADTT